jgi:DNA-binding NtrC family response regulator
VPALRDRREDIPLLFRKFAADFAERYKTGPVMLDDEARQLLISYPFPGNVRELKNLAEQISVLSTQKLITQNDLIRLLPERNSNRFPVLAAAHHNGGIGGNSEFANEREILYKLFFDMKKDVTELKKMFLEVLQHGTGNVVMPNTGFFKEDIDNETSSINLQPSVVTTPVNQPVLIAKNDIQEPIEVEESLNIMDKEKELIEKALKKHKGKRKDAATDLGISERTLYRKLKEYDIEEL